MKRIGILMTVGTLSVTSFALVRPATAGTDVMPRYASPSGSGSSCTVAAPCDIVTAINSAPATSPIHILGGSYGSSTVPIATALADSPTRSSLRISGPATGPLPVIYLSGTGEVNLLNSSSVSRLAIISTSTIVGLEVGFGSAADQVFVTASAAGFGTCKINSATLINSVCIATGTGDSAVEVSGAADETATVRGVTAIGTAIGSEGLLARETDPTSSVLATVTNSILQGVAGDAAVSAVAGGSATVTAAHTAVKNPVYFMSGGTETITTDPTDLKVRAKFVNVATGNYRERAGSLTINAGATDPVDDLHDLLGNPRTLGSAPDMGAYEFREKPTLSAFHVTKRSRHTLAVAVRADPQGLPTSVKLVATYHRHHVSSATHSAGRSSKVVAMHFTVHGLHQGRRYHLQVVARNRVGTTKTPSKTVRTKRRHRKHHHH